MDPAGLDRLRLMLGLIVVLVGLFIILAVFITATVHWSSARDVGAAISPVTTVIGTVIGAFLGMHIGSQGRERAELDRQRAEEKLEQLAAARDDATRARILGIPGAP